jgi:hypothetical protein
VCSNGKRTSILEYVAISVKKMSIFVVLHRWGTGTLLVLLVDWLGTAQDTGSHQSRTETPKPKAPANNSSVVVERTAGATAEAKDPNGITRSGHRWVSMDRGRTDGWMDGRTDEQRNEPIEEGERDQRQWRSRPRYFVILFPCLGISWFSYF